MHKLILISILILLQYCCANIAPAALGARSSNTIDHNRIVGGYDATLGEAPWQVGLFSNEYLFCGGTLVSPLVVVTAAHCMGGSFTVRLGGLDRRNLPLIYSVKKYYIHEDYDWSNVDNDIALVILEEAVNVETLEYVQAASLPIIGDGVEDNAYMDGTVSSSMPTSDEGVETEPEHLLISDNDEEYVNQTVLISGWGTLKSGSNFLPTKLQAAEVQIFSQAECKKAYNSPSYSYTDNMICAGIHNYTKDACQGDSGGPLVLRGETTDSSNILLGITSWGVGCAFRGYPGVYTKVSNYLSWIEEKSCSSNACINATLKYSSNDAPVTTTSGYYLIIGLFSLILT